MTASIWDIYECIKKREGKPTSTRQVAKMLKVPQRLVTYKFRHLETLEDIKLRYYERPEIKGMKEYDLHHGWIARWIGGDK